MLYAHKILKPFALKILLPMILEEMYEHLGEPVYEVGNNLKISLSEMKEYHVNDIIRDSKSLFNDDGVNIREVIADMVNFTWQSITKIRWQNKLLTMEMCDELYDKFYGYEGNVYDITDY